ncbi:MAG: cupin-like domain-containing protein [Xanthomonadales bacterium]|nr:cupin-like domain-containing protein [Xanthomonadales bacterium]
MNPSTDLPGDIWAGMAPVAEHGAMDRAAFETQVQAAAEPAIMRGLVSDWPAVARGRESAESLVQYITSFSNQQPIEYFYGAPDINGRFFYSDDLNGFNFERRQLTVDGFLQQLLSHLDDAAPPYMYAGGIPVPRHLGALTSDNPMTLLAPGMERLTSLWVGNRTRTAAHWDLPQNIACVIRGQRRFTLFPIDQVQNLYVGSLEFTLAGQPLSLVDFHNPDLERFPRFAEALKHAQVALLEPGDGLYIPSLWFHHVESMDPLGMMMNYWWRDAPDYMATPLLTLLHGLLTIRDLPEGERESWRVLFDHYLFQTNGDPWAHMPEDARGLFGETTPENLAKLRAYLTKTLGG